MAELNITKRCCTCKQFKSLSEFHKDRNTKDGLQRACKDCQRAYQRTKKSKIATKRYQKNEKYKTYRKHYQQSKEYKVAVEHYNKSEKGKIVNKRYHQTEKGKTTYRKSLKRYNIRHPERVAARKAVNHAIRAGRLPPVESLQCSCSEQAKQYHHHKGYELEHWLDVIPVCYKCHNKAI